MSIETQILPVDAKTILKAFSRALTREAHVLTKDHGLLWQQLFNRLQWEGEEVKQAFAMELALRSTKGAKPWIRTNAPLQESDALIRTLEGHTQGVMSCAFSPDSKFIASASLDSTLRVWDAISGEGLFILKGHNGSVYACSFSPDGCRIVSASEDKTLRTWDAITGLLLRTMEGHNDGVSSCVFSPDGNFIASTSRDKTLRVWEAETGQLLYALENQDGLGCAFSPDGERLVLASRDNTLQICGSATGQVLCTLEGHTGFVCDCAFSPDGNLIVSASSDHTLKIWESTTGILLRTLEGHIDWVGSCAFSPDGKHIVSHGFAEGYVIMWETATGKPIFNLDGESFAFSPDGFTLATANLGGSICLWDVRIALEHEVLKKDDSSFVYSSTLSPEGGNLASGSSDGTVRLWNVFTGEEQAILKGHTDLVTFCVYSPDGSTLASASRDGAIRLWDVSSGVAQFVLKGHTGFINFCAFSRDGRSLVSASDDKTIRLWDMSCGELLAVLKGHTGKVKRCSFSPDDQLIVSASEDKTLRIWDPVTGQLLRILKGHTGEVKSCKFSPSGHLIVSASDDGTLRSWNVASGKTMHVLDYRSGENASFSYSPEGRCIVTDGAYDDKVKIWNPETGQIQDTQHTLENHQDGWEKCEFSPDGQYIISTCRNNTLLVWNIADGEVISKIKLPDLGVPKIHPWQPLLVSTGQVLECVNLEYGPIVITAFENNRGIYIHCPACQNDYRIQPVGLDAECICPGSDCNLSLKVNPFVIKQTSGVKIKSSCCFLIFIQAEPFEAVQMTIDSIRQFVDKLFSEPQAYTRILCVSSDDTKITIQKLRSLPDVEILIDKPFLLNSLVNGSQYRAAVADMLGTAIYKTHEEIFVLIEPGESIKEIDNLAVAIQRVCANQLQFVVSLDGHAYTLPKSGVFNRVATLDRLCDLSDEDIPVVTKDPSLNAVTFSLEKDTREFHEYNVPWLLGMLAHKFQTDQKKVGFHLNFSLWT